MGVTILSTAVGFDGVVTQPTHDLLNTNANIQVGDVDVADGNPVPVSDAGGSLTVDGSVAVIGGVTIQEPLSVDDGGGSLTVDQSIHDNLNANANIQVGNVDVANGNPVPISDAGGSITVDGAVTIQEPLSVDDGGGSLTVDQATHDNFNANANIQVGDVDVANGNPVPISDAGGSVTVDTLSVIDTNNSTTTPLSGGTTFTGAATDLLPFQAVTIQILTDGNSAVDGMKFEFSPDGTNWDDIYLFTYIAADGSRRFEFASTAKFFRVVFVAAAGGPGTQSFIRLQVLLHPSAVLTTIHRVGDDTSPDRSAELIKAVLLAQKSGVGDFIPLQSNAAGILKVAPGNLEVLDAAVDFSNPVPVAIVAKKIQLTGSTDGLPIAITVSSSPGDVIDLTAGLGAGEGFAYFLKASFVTQAASEEDATLTLEFGGATVSENMTFSIPLEDAIVIAIGETLYADALTVAAFVGTAGQQVNITGWKELVIP